MFRSFCFLLFAIYFTSCFDQTTVEQFPQFKIVTSKIPVDEMSAIINDSCNFRDRYIISRKITVSNLGSSNIYLGVTKDCNRCFILPDSTSYFKNGHHVDGRQHYYCSTTADSILPFENKTYYYREDNDGFQHKIQWNMVWFENGEYTSRAIATRDF